MNFPTYTVQDLADFTARDVLDFVEKDANTFLAQASLLLRVATCLSKPPTEDLQLEMWKNAVLEMAMKLYIGSQHTDSKYSPFSSETIGSYSYTIAMSKINSGVDTGVMWFDLAVGQIGVCDLMGGTGAHSSGGIEVFEHDGTFIPGSHPGNERLLSPNDLTDYPTYNPGV